MKPATRFVLLVLLAVVLSGCAGAGLAGGAAGTRSRCGSNPHDDQRPLFFVFCVESP